MEDGEGAGGGALRKDGRLAHQIRPLTAEFGLIRTADGSARLAMGETRILVTVQGPRPARSLRLEDPHAALLELSVSPPGGGPGTGARELSIACFLRSLFEGAIVRTAHPRSVISVAVHLQADEGSACAAAVCATTLALVDAGVPLHAMVGAVGVAVLGPAAFPPAPSSSSSPPHAARPLLTASATAAAEAEAEAVVCLDPLAWEERLATPGQCDWEGGGGGGGGAGGGGRRGRRRRRQGGDDGEEAGGGEPSGAWSPAPIAPALFAQGTLAFTADGVGAPLSAPAGMDFSGAGGGFPSRRLPQVLSAGRAGAASVLAFLRLASRAKVLADANNFSSELSTSVAELGGAAVGPAPASEGAGASS